MSKSNIFNPAVDQTSECAVYNIDVSGRSPTGGIRDEVCGALESLVVWRHPMQHSVILGLDYEEIRGSKAGLTHRWFCLSLDEARRLAAALLNAIDTDEPRDSTRTSRD